VRELGVSALKSAQDMDIDIVRHTPDAVHAKRDLLRHHLLRVGADVAAERDDILVHGNADVADIQTGLPLERAPHTLFKTRNSHSLSPVI